MANISKVTLNISGTKTTYNVNDQYASKLIPYGTAIGSNANLNTVTYLKVGNYYCSANVTVATLTNCPTTSAFMMQVYSPLSTTINNESSSTWVYRIRKLLDYTGNEYIQYVYSGSTAGTFTYKDWKKNATTNDITLSALGVTSTAAELNLLDGVSIEPYSASNGATALGWSSTDKTTNRIPTINLLAYWNGAYQGTSSNLSYCSGGTIASQSWVDDNYLKNNTDNVIVKSSSTDVSTVAIKANSYNVISGVNVGAGFVDVGNTTQGTNIYGNNVYLNNLSYLTAPTTAKGSTYGYGSAGQVLMTRGTNMEGASVYWGTPVTTTAASGNTSSKIFLIGRTSQTSSGGTTYSHDTAYVDTSGRICGTAGLYTNKLYIPTTSSGTSYGVGSSGQVLKSNGSTVYWGTDNNTTYTLSGTYSGTVDLLYNDGDTGQSTNYRYINVDNIKILAMQLTDTEGSTISVYFPYSFMYTNYLIIGDFIGTSSYSWSKANKLNITVVSKTTSSCTLMITTDHGTSSTFPIRDGEYLEDGLCLQLIFIGR